MLFVSILDYFDFNVIYTSFLKNQSLFVSILKFFSKKVKKEKADSAAAASDDNDEFDLPFGAIKKSTGPCCDPVDSIVLGREIPIQLTWTLPWSR